MIVHSEIAPAKLNLALHVRGKLDDGRHAIETLFAFCIDGDRLSAEPADELSLDVRGHFGADTPAGPDNLVLRAAQSLRERSGVADRARLTLDKRLPVASGMIPSATK